MILNYYLNSIYSMIVGYIKKWESSLLYIQLVWKNKYKTKNLFNIWTGNSNLNGTKIGTNKIVL